MAREDVDLIVQIPLEEEYLQFVSIFTTKENRTEGVNATYVVDAPSSLRVIVTLQEKMGRTAALSACMAALDRFNPKLYVCLGIAGGLSKDLKLGDVCYTGTLVDVLDNSKITDNASGGIDVAFAPEFYDTDRRLTAAIGFSRTLTELRPRYLLWQENQGLDADHLRLGEIPGRTGRETLSAPKALNGDIVCGSVAQSAKYQERLKGVARDLLAIETESGGVFSYCRDKAVQTIAVRGISDYANASKSELEGQTKNEVRAFAARNAASFLRMQLESPTFLEALRESVAISPLLPLTSDASFQSVPKVLEILSAQIDQKLRELSPQYKTKPVGYRLPSPRLREIESSVVGGSRQKPTSLEITAALAREPRVVVQVPRTYPDPALSWVLANGLLLAEISEKKLIPIVINGADIGPPRFGLDHLSAVGLSQDVGDQGGEYVFIVDNPPLTSRTKLAFLVEEAKKWSSSKFIFVTRDERSIIKEADFEKLVGATPFNVCDVSFSEMASFIEKTFEIPSVQAEVIALQLRTMFQRFSLPAHPSFFAGIPQETLSALLLANKRSELIQIAVDGYLSFVVASDRQTIRMSRTNRSKFLRRLVVELCLEKRTFSQSELVAYAQKISDEFDYGLNALAFVQSFEEKGIIHFENSGVKITLPFIQAYLLADELTRNPELADRYFDINSDDFDLLCFDLYCEINPSAHIVDRVRDALRTVLDESAQYERHMLLTNEIDAAFLRNPRQMRSLGKRVNEAKDALENGDSDRTEKVKILDLVDRVNEDVAEAERDDTENVDNELYKDLVRLGRIWVISTVLLGSGAESINGKDRLGLSELILESGEKLIQVWVSQANNLDYEQIKNKILADKDFKASVKPPSDDEYEKLVTALVDFIEYLSLCTPLERVTNQMLDQARHRIIANSLTKTELKGEVAKLLRAIWLTEIDFKAGSDSLKQAAADLPPAVFLRSALTSLLIFRVKWKLSDTQTRHALLDFAEAVIRPLNPHLDKGELLRFVDKNDPSSIATAK